MNTAEKTFEPTAELLLICIDLIDKRDRKGAKWCREKSIGRKRDMLAGRAPIESGGQRFGENFKIESEKASCFLAQICLHCPRLDCELAGGESLQFLKSFR